MIGINSLSYGGKSRYKWREMVPVWQKYIDSYLGGVNYQKSRYLIQGSTEDDKKFNLRVKTSGYTNLCKPVINGLTKHIYKQPITRDGLDDIVVMIDFDSKSIDHFWRDAVNLLAVYGEVYLYVQYPDADDDITLYDVAHDDALRFKVTIVPPQNVPWFDKDEAIILKEYYNGMNMEVNAITLTAETIKTQEEEHSNPFGVIPLFKLIVDQNKDGIGESILADIADLNNMIHNLNSSAYSECINSAFSSLMLPWTQEIQRIYDKQFPQEKGLDGVERPVYRPREIMLYPAGYEFSYLSKDISGIQFKMSLVDKLRDDIQSLGNQKLQDMLLNQSGIAKAYDFMTYSSQLSALARIIESFEEKFFTFIVEYIKPGYKDWAVNYPEDFDIITEEKKANLLKELLKLSIGKTATARITKELLKQALVFEDDELDKIEQEILGEQERQAQAPVPLPLQNDNNVQQDEDDDKEEKEPKEVE